MFSTRSAARLCSPLVKRFCELDGSRECVYDFVITKAVDFRCGVIIMLLLRDVAMCSGHTIGGVLKTLTPLFKAIITTAIPPLLLCLVYFLAK